jgi:hypothetical protein
MPSFNSTALPLITINSVVANGQTQINFYLSNYSTKVYGYGLGISNLPTSGTSNLVNAIKNWFPQYASSSSSLSDVSIDLTMSNPIVASSPTLFATYTLSNAQVTQPIAINSLSLSSQNANASGYSDISFDQANFNFAFTGNVGFSVADNTRAGGNAGNTGFDTFSFPDAFKNYTVTNKNSVLNVSSSAGTLYQFANGQRLKFSDLSLAFDMNGNAGQVVKILGAVFGKDAVNKTDYVAIGLKNLDQGVSYSDLMALALNARLGANYTNAAEITLLYQNLLNTAPSATDLNNWNAALQNKTYTNTSLAQFACDSNFNTQNINLTGLADKGVLYLSTI